ncbi:hypothetical protein FN846DRAFT_756085, partial [Sphaerosporella brunnea]
CQFCGCLLLQGEKHGWCCREEQYTLTPLPPYPIHLQTLFTQSPQDASFYSRKLNQLFCFSTIGVSGSFQHLPIPANIAISGRVYHQLRDVNTGQNSMRWFLYEEEERNRQAVEQQVPIQYVNGIRWLLNNVNSFLLHLRH